MGEAEAVRRLVAGAAAALEASRSRIDDLNVYPVPDGDTGTNLALTVRAVLDALESTVASDRAALAQEVSRAALMGARGNSGVILSQIVRGAADALAAAGALDARAVAEALQSASDAAYRGVRRPVEGTMLTAIRELAEEAERLVSTEVSVAELLAALVPYGEEVVARTPDQLPILREAGVVDAGAAGLVELVRGLAAAVAGHEPAKPAGLGRPGVASTHQELSRFRYCTSFVVEGEALDAAALEVGLERLGDSVLVVGDPTALKLHVHTDDPGAALTLATAVGILDGVEIADMHRQTQAREQRLLHAVPEPERVPTAVVAVVAGAGNRELFESLGASAVVEGGPTMNPSVGELTAAIESWRADEVIVLPNDPNVIGSAEAAAAAAATTAYVVPTRSIPEGLAAMVAFDGNRPATENLEQLRAAVAAVATGEVAIASRTARLNGLSIREGDYLGLAAGRPVAAGAELDEVATTVVRSLLEHPRSVLTILTGDGDPDVTGLIAWLRDEHPELELDVHQGGQPHYPLLISAE